MGDFYELFFDDARKAQPAARHHADARAGSSAGEPVVMAGVPFHSVESYLAKLIKLGEAVGDLRAGGRRGHRQGPGRAQGGARRHAGHADRHRTAGRQERCAAAGASHRGSQTLGPGLAGADAAANWAWPNAATPNCRPGWRGCAGRGAASIGSACRRRCSRRAPRVTHRPAWQFDSALGLRKLCEQLQVASLAGFDAQELHAAHAAAAALLSYRRAHPGPGAGARAQAGGAAQQRPARAAAHHHAQPGTDPDLARRGRTHAVFAAGHLPHRHGQPRAAPLAAHPLRDRRVATERHEALAG